MPNELYDAWLEETPNILYGAKIPTGTSPFADYWRSQYSNVYNDYMGQLGKQALSGTAPTLNFEDYLSQFPFMKQWYAMNPSQRGERTPSSYRWRL